jgi:hypothetical protein
MTVPVLADVELIDPVIVNIVAPAEPRLGLISVGLLARTTAPVPVEVVLPVPPFKTGKAVPDRVIARVPLLVIGEPLTLKNAGTEAATEVTVPVVSVVHVIGLLVPPPETKACPADPALVGRLKLNVPATACGKIETVPEVDPLASKDPLETDDVHDNEVEDKVVNAPVLGVVDPIAPGISKVLPFKVLEFKLATLVVLVTIRGAVPVAILLTR